MGLRWAKGEGLSPLFVKEVSSSDKLKFLTARKVTLLEKANLCRYLSAMIGAGLPLSETVDVLCSETKNPGLKEILNDVRASVQKGQFLSTAFAKYPNVFDEIFLTLVKAGEESGTLDKSFEYLGTNFSVSLLIFS